MSKRKLLENYIYSSFYQVFIIIVPLITAPYMARVLMPEGTGINSFVSTMIQMITLFGLIGLNGYSSREIAYVRDDKEKLNRTFVELYIVRMILALITVIVYLIYASTSEYSMYFYVSLPVVFATFIDISWVYSGLEEFKITVLRNFIIKILSVATIFIFIKDKNDLYLYLGLTAFWSILGNLLIYFGLRKRITKFKYNNLHLKKHIIPSIKLFLPQVASVVYLQFDKVMIKYLTDNVTQVGFYEQAERIVKMPIALITAFSTVMMPRLSNVFKNNQFDEMKKYLMHSFQFSLFLAIPMMFGLLAISKTMIPWFLGAGYEDVVPIMMLLSPIVLFISLSSVSGSQYLTATNNTKVLTISYVIAATLNLVINYFSIIKLGGVGAAIGTICAEMIVVIIQLRAMKHIIGTKDILAKSVKYIISGVMMLVVCLMIGEFLKATILTTLIQIFAGSIVYFVLLVILKDKFFFENMSLILGKLKAKFAK